MKKIIIINKIFFFYIFKYCLFFNLESKSTLKEELKFCHGKLQPTSFRMLNAITKVTSLLFCYFFEEIVREYFHATSQKKCPQFLLYYRYFFFSIESFISVMEN